MAQPLRHYDWITSAEFNWDGSFAVTTSRDMAFIWNVETGKTVGQPMRHQDDVLSARFSRDGRMVVTASQDHTARVWDAETGLPEGEPLRHDGIVRDARFSETAERVITASDDGTARAWELLNGSLAEAPVLAALAEAVGGSVLNPQGNDDQLSDTIARLSTLRQQTALAHGASVVAFVRWFLTNRTGRSRFPWSEDEVHRRDSRP